VKNLSLRYKLMVITSGLIIVSLVVLSVISIRNFTKDKTDTSSPHRRQRHCQAQLAINSRLNFPPR
jgi:hypothetical protein